MTMDKIIQIPKISIVMPVWNGERYLKEAVESILAQTFSNFELIIIDDGSTDTTHDIIKNYSRSDKRVRVIRLAHEGIVVALNRGVQESRADWIARMDCDDIANPQRLEKQWKALQRNPDAVLCHTNIQTFGSPGIGRPQHFPRTKKMLLIRMCLHCAISHPSVIFSKKAFMSAGGYRLDERHAEDYALWQRMLPLGDVIGLPERLLQFRVHEDSISKKASSVQMALTVSIREKFVRMVFPSELHNMGKRLERFCGLGKQTPDPSDIWPMLNSLASNRLLNPETTVWFTVRSARRLFDSWG
jgi:glycosyltransferase involved in cell wall biosynthesis